MKAYYRAASRTVAQGYYWQVGENLDFFVERAAQKIVVLKSVDIFLHPLDEFDKGRIEAILTKDSDLNYFQIRVKYLGRSQETWQGKIWLGL